MKKMIAMSIVSCALALCACGGSDSDNGADIVKPSEITCSPTSIEAPAVGGTYTVNVTANGEWTAYTNGDNWVKVSTTGSNTTSGTATIIIAANKDNASRQAVVTVKSGTARQAINISQQAPLKVSKSEVRLSSKGESITIDVDCASTWTAIASDNWITTAKNGNQLTITATANEQKQSRNGKVTVKTDNEQAEIAVIQNSAEDRDIKTPEGYALVWHDEFNEGTQLNSAQWEWENQNAGWVNNEKQNYRPGTTAISGKHTTEIVDGFLHINCFKGDDGKIYSGRINAKNGGKGWQYGYIEARMMLPKGKGTWPAFWMMPISVDWTNEGWPKCGEIDIMEEVGCVPNEVSSSLHAEGHYHANNTQITKARNIGTAETEYHVYAIEWTADYIKTYVDGELLLSYNSDHTIRNYPYDKPFHIILNLAWGGSWGGMKGEDESALPVTMKVDYVRVFQKN